MYKTKITRGACGVGETHCCSLVELLLPGSVNDLLNLDLNEL